MITGRRKFTTKLTDPLPLELIQSHLLYATDRKPTYPNFGQRMRSDFAYENQQYAAVLVLSVVRYGKNRLNSKLKISNAADYADNTQSEARDLNTRHRRMQEVNSQCTDSEPLRANAVLCHDSTIYST